MPQKKKTSRKSVVKKTAKKSSVSKNASRRNARRDAVQRKVIRKPLKKRPARVVMAVPPVKKSRIDWAQSYTNLLLGIIVVVIGVLFVASIFRSHPNQQVTSISTQAPTTTPSSTLSQPRTYTVQPGDDLWHIAEKEYSDGYQWVVIAQANNITNPSFIYTNDKLIIPVITPTPATSLGAIIATPTPTPSTDSGSSTPTSQAITTDTYVVEPGDDLWHIAIRKYANGYRWVDIARANNLAEPNYIHKGDILKLPR